MAMKAQRRGGRPSRQQAAALQEKILDVATALFLSDGFGATSIEAVARRAGISKRTFYHRFRDKSALFEAVIRRLIDRWLQASEERLGSGLPIEAALRQSARQILAVALSPEALALYRVLLAEAQRFPELARALDASGAARGIRRIAELLERETKAGRLAVANSGFAAEQFLAMVLSVPRRRALGFGPPLAPAELERWADDTVTLFLAGCRGARGKP